MTHTTPQPAAPQMFDSVQVAQMFDVFMESPTYKLAVEWIQRPPRDPRGDLSGIHGALFSAFRDGLWAALSARASATPQPQALPELPTLDPSQPLESNLNALASNPQAAIKAFGVEWAGWCAASALKALASQPPAPADAGRVPRRFAMVPIHPTRAMERLMQRDEWTWAELLAVAEAVDEAQYDASVSGPPETATSLAEAAALLQEAVDLCAVGDIDEGTDDGLGWAGFVRDSKQLLAALEMAPAQPPSPQPEPAVSAPARPAQQGEARLPEGWVPLRLEWEPGYPEDVAFGPQMMMDRLKKWLDKHFARVVAERNAEDGWAAPDYRKAWQGGLTNAELEQWWRLKLPHVDATNRDISVFALGVEVGAGFGTAPKPPVDGAPPAPPAVESAALDVLAERKRQVEVEGWTPEHDDEHSNGDLAQAAAFYALVGQEHEGCRIVWPWEESWMKICDNRRNLVKAGALILAEIERLDRRTLSASAGASPSDSGDQGS
jgi:hypothetical protein